MSAALPGIWYLDSPEDGASAHVLQELGVTVTRADRTAASSLEGFSHAASFGKLPVTAEHKYAEAVAYEAIGEGLSALDLRDSADAYIRITAQPGDIITIAPGVYHRIVPAHSKLFELPVWGSNPDRDSKQCTVVFPPPLSSPLPSKWGSFTLHTITDKPLSDLFSTRYVIGSKEEAESLIPHTDKPGIPSPRHLVVELCSNFYGLGWVTGTGGSISIRHGNRIFMAPSGVQKERMQPQDIFVLDTAGKEIYAPRPLPGKPRLKLSQCAPLFQHAFSLRNAGACIHTHDISAVMATLENDTEWKITHQEMIKGILGHGFLDECVVPIIENTPHECDLADSLQEAMMKYPKSNAVLVRRHGVYVWGPTWEAAKTQAECYHYLFDASVRMRGIGIDPGMVPEKVSGGIGADTSYGSALAALGGKKNRPTTTAVAPPPAPCCSGAGAHGHHDSTSAGFHGTQGTSSLAVETASATPLPLAPADASHVVLDIEGATTSLSFVTDVLFPYAAKHCKQFLADHWGTPELTADVRALQEQSRADMAAGLVGATLWAVTPEHVEAAERGGKADEGVIDAIAGNVTWQMDANRKTGALKQLQGHIWRAGYESGALRGHVFADTPEALRAWVAGGKKVYIYSSGSREAQRLLFANTTQGDLRPYLSGYFDTKVGAKVEAPSYKEIVLSLGVDKPSQILFATDSLAEAKAAAQAGIMVAITDRPGNLPLPANHGFPVVTSLMELVVPA